MLFLERADLLLQPSSAPLPKKARPKVLRTDQPFVLFQADWQLFQIRPAPMALACVRSCDPPIPT